MVNDNVVLVIGQHCVMIIQKKIIAHLKQNKTMKNNTIFNIKKFFMSKLAYWK